MKINVERNDVKEWLDLLSKASTSEKSGKLWARVREILAVPARRRASVNLYKLNKYTKEGDNVVVPGKVLSMGELDHTINIVALEYSKKAAEQLTNAGCRMMSLSEMLPQKRVSIIK